MKYNQRLLSGVVLVLMILGIASAGYKDYTVDWAILPEDSYENTDVTIFGYIDIDDLGKIVPINNFSLRIMDGSTVKKHMKLTDTALSYINDYNNDEWLLNGFFYTSISGLDKGIYSAIISIEDEDIGYQSFEVKDGESNFSVTLGTITTNNGPILEVDYTGDTSIVNVDLYLYGRKNFDNPKKVSISGISNTETYHVPELTDFDLSDYVGEDEVYGFVVYGELSDGTNPAETEVIVKNTGFKSIITDADASLTSKTLKKGVEESLTLSIENNGTLLTSYDVEVTGSLSAYVTVSDSFEIMPDGVETESLKISVPRAYLPSTGNLTITVKVGGVTVEQKSYTMTLLAAEPVHSIRVDSVIFSESYYFKGDFVKGNISLINDGDYTEYVDVQYFFENGEVSKSNEVSLSAGETKNITIFTRAGDESTLVISATNDYLSYIQSFDVNIATKNYAFNFYLSNNDLISQDSATETASLIVENTGNVDDLFVVTSAYPNLELSNKSVIVAHGESASISALVSLPTEDNTLNVTFTTCSQLGNECMSALFLVSIFRTEEQVQGSESVINVTDESLVSALEEAAIYDVYVTNNRLVAKNYELTYETNASVDFSVYPGTSFTVQPGETMKVSLSAYPSAAGVYDINYTIKEEGVELGSGALTLTAGSGAGGITGFFALAAGSVLGVAGLIVLALFIYFYFIRQPPSGGDDFKPVEVKKADLTKPNVKNEDKYW